MGDQRHPANNGIRDSKVGQFRGDFSEGFVNGVRVHEESLHFPNRAITPAPHNVIECFHDMISMPAQC
jgi:hypothetical protein